ncbi:MAG: HAMP domain-containing histidine kinase [Oscillospiraceae bacterium]|nr:HAMP domain-containing histidine kinase [Oscillospiraceae bacterium]
MLPWVLCGILSAVLIILFIKNYMLKKSMAEIRTELAEKLNEGSNTLISVSSRDKHIRLLASELNNQLRSLRRERHRFIQGDTELKNAVTNISHDLRTPLTAICGYLDLLELEEKTEKTERYIGIIKNRAALLTQLTEELFRYSIVVSAQSNEIRESVVLNSVLEESIASFYTALRERNITPNIMIPEEKVIRNLDRSALVRVFSNLLNNAVKYSDGDLDITLLKTGEIIFTNTAASIDEVQVGRLFDRFYTVEAARKSTGLGLSIARTLTQQMNGRISARYEDNKLSIKIFFPAE